jgi:hypothetical protein
LATLKERRKADRIRNLRFREKLKAEGGKVQNLYLDAEATKRLQQIKQKTGKTYTEIINGYLTGTIDTAIDLRADVNRLAEQLRSADLKQPGMVAAIRKLAATISYLRPQIER